MSEQTFYLYMSILFTIALVLIIGIIGYMVITDRTARKQKFEDEIRSYPPARGLVTAPGKHSNKMAQETRPEQEPEKMPTSNVQVLPEQRKPETLENESALKPPDPNPIPPAVEEIPKAERVEDVPPPVHHVPVPAEPEPTKEPTKAFLNPLPSLPEPVAKAVTKVVRKQAAKKVVKKPGSTSTRVQKKPNV